VSRALEVEQPTTTFTLEPIGPFSLAAAAMFWGGFTPAGHPGLDAEGHLHMAFSVEGSWQPAGVCLRQCDSSVTADVFSDVDVQAVRQQTARVLSLDVDGRGLRDVAIRDPVAARLLEQFPGLRPVCFYSAYEAGVWAILSHRIQMRQASAIKARLAESFGATVSIHGQPMRAFPSPRTLVDLREFPGLTAPKPARIAALAAAAVAGDLDAATLRALPDADALARLQTLPGIGPFSSELILLRGAGHPDYLTLHEPRFRRAVAEAYGLHHEPSDADLQRISEAWRPYRMWITFLLRQAAAR
jgi:DNA-3-methyladenine glycosylase II